MAAKTACLLLSIFISICEPFENRIYCARDYYWRDYVDGVIPADALTATANETSQTFIGQVPAADGSLLVGQIHGGYDDITVTLTGRILHRNQFIKILCTRNPRDFAWIKTGDGAILRGDWVVGGNQEGYPLYIGRINHGGLRIGQVYYLPAKNISHLSVPYMETKLVVSTNYEILTHTRNLCRSDIDF